MGATTPIKRQGRDPVAGRRCGDERGIALAIAIFALVLLAAVVAGGYFTATQEFQIGRSMRSLTSSFYAGEAAVHEVLEDWDPLVFGVLAVGDSVMYGPVDLPGGGSYDATVVRVGEPSDSIKRYFYIEVEGRPSGSNLGARRQAVVVRAMFPDVCCPFAAATVYSSITFGGGGGSQPINGNNQDPPGVWPAAVCTGLPTDNAAGALVDVSTTIDPSEAINRIAGQPGTLVTTLDPVGMLTFNGLTYNDLVGMADHTFVGDHTMFDSNPTLDGSGACNGTNPNNWGEPDNPAHPCYDHFPIIHVTGTLSLRGAGSAQGILLADGGIEFIGPYDFYGIAISKGTFEMSGQTDFWGGVIVAGALRFSGSSPSLKLSRCAAERAQRLSNLGRPRLVAPRSWVELF